MLDYWPVWLVAQFKPKLSSLFGQWYIQDVIMCVIVEHIYKLLEDGIYVYEYIDLNRNNYGFPL